MKRTLVLLTAGLLLAGVGTVLPQTAAAADQHGYRHGDAESLVGLYFVSTDRHRHHRHWSRSHNRHRGHGPSCRHRGNHGDYGYGHGDRDGRNHDRGRHRRW